MIEDIALMRVLPRMRVLVPADYPAAKECIRLAAETPGPFYVRLGRASDRVMHDGSLPHVLGKAHVPIEGGDVTLIACGVMVERAMDAVELLKEQGISAELIDCYSIKPLDVETIVASAAKTGAVVTCEEHSVIGGLGSAVAEALAEHQPTRMIRVGVQDRFGTSGDPEELMRHFGLTADDVAKAARGLLGR
jgi:transketolase